MEVATRLRNLGLGGSAALSARLDAGELHPGVAPCRVGIDDAIGVSAAQQAIVVDVVPAKPAAPEVATVP